MAVNVTEALLMGFMVMLTSKDRNGVTLCVDHAGQAFNKHL